MLEDDRFALIRRGGRSIDVLVPHVTLEEAHRDDLAITQHPVEGGATISDHAFSLPHSVDMRVAWSNSTAGTEGFAQEVYQELLALQNAKEPFDVSTGKRFYTNMLMRGLSVVTDERSEHTLMVSCRLQHVIITNSTQSGTPQGDQAMPEKTAAPSETGTKELTRSYQAGEFGLSGPNRVSVGNGPLVGADSPTFSPGAIGAPGTFTI